VYARGAAVLLLCSGCSVAFVAAPPEHVESLHPVVANLSAAALFGASAIYGVVVSQRCRDAIAAQNARLRDYRRDRAKRLRMPEKSAPRRPVAQSSGRPEKGTIRRTRP